MQCFHVIEARLLNRAKQNNLETVYSSLFVFFSFNFETQAHFEMLEFSGELKVWILMSSNRETREHLWLSVFCERCMIIPTENSAQQL